MKPIAVIMLLTLAICSATATEEAQDIIEIQQAIIDADAGWTPGETTVSGLTRAAQEALTLPGPPPAPRGVVITAPPVRALSFEERFDWRDKGCVTPVKYQGMCGSCWAFAAVGTMESAFLVHVGMETDLSEQHLISKCCQAGNCDGGWPDLALEYARDVGIPSEECYPYAAYNTECAPCDGWEEQVYRINGTVYVLQSTEAFKYALKKYGPLSVVLTVPNDWYYYRSGVYEPVRQVGYANHAVVLVGWDDSDGCWFIKNSWGTGWGEQGFARVKYGDLEQYNYAHAITGVMGRGDQPDPVGWRKPVSATATSQYNDENYHAERAIDNSTTTHWFSKCGEVDPTITFDVGEVVTISRVRAIVHPSDIPLTVDIAVSDDRVVWSTVAESVLITVGGEYVEIPIKQSVCRYVRMTQTSTGRVYGTCTEFDVLCAVEDPPTPITTKITLTYGDGTTGIITPRTL